MIYFVRVPGQDDTVFDDFKQAHAFMESNPGASLGVLDNPQFTQVKYTTMGVVVTADVTRGFDRTRPLLPPLKGDG